MTLITCTLNFNNPILMGDLLITSDQKEDDLLLPKYLRGIEKHFPNQALHPIKLRQKLYIINEKLCIGLAGNVFEIKNFLADIKTFFRYRITTHDTISEFLQDYHDIDQNFILITPTFDGHSGFNYYAKGNWISADDVSFEKIFAVGSGAADFVNEAQKGWLIEDNKGPDLIRARFLNYSVLASLIGKERFSLETVQKYWGAGLEMVYFENDQFKKMDDITYLLWHCKYENNSFEPVLYLVLNYKYYEELLVISSYDQEGTFDLRGVLPIDRTAEEFEHTKADVKLHFDAKHTCSVFIIHTSEGRVFTPVVSTEDQGSEMPSVKVTYDGNQLQVMMREDIQKYVHEIAKSKI